MSVGFTRRWTYDPGNSVLTQIEGVAILDRQPPQSIIGVGSGTTCIVGEFENGPFGVTTEVTSATQLASLFGGLGYTYAGTVGQNPCARQRFADSATVAEYWNGNGAVQLNGKAFSRLLIMRVNTSCGAVGFTRQANLLGGSLFRYALLTGQTLAISIDGAGAVTATFSGAAATVSSVTDTYANITAGMTLILGVDAQPNFTVTFLAGDTTQANVIARINQYAGYTMASSASSTSITLTGLQAGTGGQVRVVGGTALSIASTTVAAGSNGTNQPSAGVIDVAGVVGFPTAGTLAIGAGWATYTNVSGGNSFTGCTRGTGTTALTTGEAVTGTVFGLAVGNTAGTGNVANISAVAPSEINTIVSTATSSAVKVEQLATGQLRMYMVSVSPTADTLQITTASTATAFGFPFGVTDAASTGNAGIIPAGTVVGVPSGNQYVTMQDVSVTATAIAGVTPSGAGPYSVPIRPATDDNVTVTTGALVGTVTAVGSSTPILLDSYAVTNPLPVAVPLTDSQIDAAYISAITATLNSQNVSHDINIIWSARQSNAVRRQMKVMTQTAGDGGGVGVLGRVAVIRPPIGTLASTAESTVAEPGVGAYSYERVIYAYPGVTTTIPAIATIGLAGGTGFTSTGIVTAGSDGFLCSVMSQLNPEENPGQLTTFTGAAIALEPNVNGGNPLAIGDYINFKANGICAAKFTSGTLIFQSGVTSVNPAAYPSLAPIHRRRMADYIQDSIATALDPFSKQLMTLQRRQAVVLTVNQFLIGLLSPTNLNLQRIAGFFLDGKTPNIAPAGGISPTSLGIFRLLILVTTLPSMDDLVLDTQIGDSVVTVQTT
jgi:hypothetical protein